MAEDASVFLEVFCKSSCKIRRFAKGTDSQFALQLINERLGNGLPLASYIQAVKEGEEPIFFGPKSILIDYGGGWKLQTASNEGFGKEISEVLQLPRDNGCEKDNGGEPVLEQPPMDEGPEKDNGIDYVILQFHRDEVEIGFDNENGVDPSSEQSCSEGGFAKDNHIQNIINQFHTDEDLGKENCVEPIWKQIPTDDGFEQVNGEKPASEQFASDEGNVEKSTLKKFIEVSAYPSLPSPEPLTMIQSIYGSDDEEREWPVPDPNEVYPDLTEAFTTQTEFEGKEQIVDWCKKVGSENGTVIITRRSDGDKNGRRPRVILQCDRSGTFQKRSRPQTKEKTIQKRQRNLSTKKCNCPFKIKGILRNQGRWKIAVICGTHNHHLLENVDGHPTYARLTQDEATFVTQMSKAGFKPSQVLDALKKRDPNNVSTLPTIYNFRAKHGLTKALSRHVSEVEPSP